MKRLIGAVVAVFIVTQITDFLIHVVLLKPVYDKTPELWRPEADMKMVLMTLVALLFVICIALIYDLYFKQKNLKTGLIYGLLLGVGIGASMGYGTYSAMPIPYAVALGWFLGTIIQLTLAGAVLGLILKERN